jgi:mRNA interferase MazF
MVIERFGVFLVNFDPIVGSEIGKTRPCVIVTPDEMNRHLRTVIAAPMTSARRGYPSRVPCVFQRKRGEVVLDQLRTIDKTRLIRQVGALDLATARKLLAALQEMFS